MPKVERAHYCRSNSKPENSCMETSALEAILALYINRPGEAGL